MDLVNRTFSASEASRYSGISQDVLRDWRRRGVLEGVGAAQPSGRWLFSFHEIILLAIVRTLEPNGQSIAVLFFMAHHLFISVLQELRPDDEFRDFARKLSCFWYNETDGQMMGPMRIQSLEDWSSIPSAFPQIVLIDSERLAAAMPETLRSALAPGRQED